MPQPARWTPRLALCAIAATLACQDAAAPAPVAIDAVGWWGGMASNNRAFMLRVVDNRIEELWLQYQVASPTCSGSGTISAGPSAPLTDNTFTMSRTTGTAFVMTGAFTSSTAASGTLSVTNSCGSANLTWQAGKFGAVPDVTPPPTGIDGWWGAIQATDYPFMFRIESSVVKEILMRYRIQNSTCNLAGSFPTGANAPVVGQVFTVDHPLVGLDPGLQISGTLTGTSSASGTLVITHDPCGVLETSWTAVKLDL